VYGCYFPNGAGACTGVTNIADVGAATLGAGLWGQLDLAGELWEWNLDWDHTNVDPCTDCAYLTATINHRAQGGSFMYAAAGLVPPYRGSFSPPYRSGNIYYGGYAGIRCSRSP
jgi:formylglycine-generating enzyme required for sulfatase activity